VLHRTDASEAVLSASMFTSVLHISPDQGKLGTISHYQMNWRKASSTSSTNGR